MSSSSLSTDVVLFTADQITRTLRRLAHELIEHNQSVDHLVLMGIITRGKPLALRMANLLQQLEGSCVPTGHLDITPFRDDADNKTPKSATNSHVPVDITGKTVVLIDDVLYSGRSIRAALDALNGYGRPAAVQLMVLLDRGHRELPIRPDFVGKNVPTAPQERIYVQLTEVDGHDQVLLRRPGQ